LRVDVIAGAVGDDGAGVGVEEVSQDAQAALSEEVVVANPCVLLLVCGGANAHVDGLRDAATRVVQDDRAELRRQRSSLVGALRHDHDQREVDSGSLLRDRAEGLFEGVESVAERREHNEDLASGTHSLRRRALA
jgi:hypothetical protein